MSCKQLLPQVFQCTHVLRQTFPLFVSQVLLAYAHPYQHYPFHNHHRHDFLRRIHHYTVFQTIPVINYAKHQYAELTCKCMCHTTLSSRKAGMLSFAARSSAYTYKFQVKL